TRWHDDTWPDFLRLAEEGAFEVWDVVDLEAVPRLERPVERGREHPPTLYFTAEPRDAPVAEFVEHLPHVEEMTGARVELGSDIESPNSGVLHEAQRRVEIALDLAPHNAHVPQVVRIAQRGPERGVRPACIGVPTSQTEPLHFKVVRAPELRCR